MPMNRQYKLGIGSFCFAYNAGINGFRPENPMSATDLLEEARRLGYQGVQLCENMGYSEHTDASLRMLGKKAEELGLYIEAGMNNLTGENLERHLSILEPLSCDFLRIVPGETRATREETPGLLRDRAAAILKEALPVIKKRSLKIGLENHFDIPSADLVSIVKEIDDSSIGLILDTTNCLGFIERPGELLEAFAPYLMGIHIKDYTAYKIPGGYQIAGVPLGEGMQDVKGLLRRALAINPALSVTLEMPVHPEPGQSMEDLVQWEKTAVRISTVYLKKVLEML